MIRFLLAGYGNLAPKTGPGKLVTMLYALIGKHRLSYFYTYISILLSAKIFDNMLLHNMYMMSVCG